MALASIVRSFFESGVAAEVTIAALLLVTIIIVYYFGYGRD